MVSLDFMILNETDPTDDEITPPAELYANDEPLEAGEDSGEDR
jgi:hypothetical protein